MKTTVAEQEGSNVRLDVEVSAEEVQEGLQATIRKLAREVKLPGFRKGKVPASFIEQRFGEHALIHQMLEDYLSTWYGAAVAESGITPVDAPKVDYDDEPERGRAFTFNATVPVMPQPALGEYKGLEVPKEKPEVGDEEVGARVDRLREEFAELRVVTDRPVEKGDFVTIDARGSRDGEPVENAVIEDYALEVGRGQLVEALEEALIGLEPGSETVVAVTMPEDYGVEELDGKTLDFAVAVKEVKEKVLPPLNDEFAKDVSEFVTLLELRLDVRKKLKAAKDMAAQRLFRNAAVRAAVVNARVDLPPVVVERQARDMVEDFARSVVHQGGDFAQYLEATGSTVEAMMQDVSPDAEIQVKTGLVLDAIAATEELTVADEQIDARVVALAAAGRVDAAEMRARLDESGRIDDIRQQLLRELAADLIVEHAVAVAPVPPEQDAAALEQPASAEQVADSEGRVSDPSAAEPAADDDATEDEDAVPEGEAPADGV